MVAATAPLHLQWQFREHLSTTVIICSNNRNYAIYFCLDRIFNGEQQNLPSELVLVVKERLWLNCHPRSFANQNVSPVGFVKKKTRCSIFIPDKAADKQANKGQESKRGCRKRGCLESVKAFQASVC